MVNLELPLIEGIIFLFLVNLEYMTLKPYTNFSLFNNTTITTLIISKTQPYSISLPIISVNREILYSHSVFLRNIGSRIGETFAAIIEQSPDDAMKCLQEAKFMLENVINSHLDFLKAINLYNSDDTIVDFVHQISSVTQKKMLIFTIMLIKDINESLEKFKNKEVNLCDLHAIKQSLMFYRPVNLADERFLEDIIDLI
jgi:hypothetical protein